MNSKFTTHSTNDFGSNKGKISVTKKNQKELVVILGKRYCFVVITQREDETIQSNDSLGNNSDPLKDTVNYEMIDIVMLN